MRISNKQYDEMVKKASPNSPIVLDCIKAFLIGGLICAAVQILLDRTKLMPGRVMVLLVCTGAVLGFIGAYEPFVKFAGAGANVPLLGFGNVLWKGVNFIEADR